MNDVLKVDVWSDIACPWCYVGRRRFDKGVRRYHDSGGDRAIQLEYHSFELAADTPVDFEGSEVEFLADHKGIPLAQARQMIDQMTQLARSEGLDFDYDSVRHTNTRKAHELLHLAKHHGVQVEMKERLLRAYFIEGRHLGDNEVLASLAAEVGVDREVALGALAAHTYRDAVAADLAQARAYGINGVPFFVLDGRYGVSGAQDPAVFAEALHRAAEDAPQEITRG